MITKELADLIDQMDRNQAIAPSRFVKAMYIAFRDFIEPGHQTDIVELWNLLADQIGDEAGNAAPNGAGAASVAADHPFVQRADAAWAKAIEKHWSPWTNTTLGFMVCQVHCKTCDALYHNFETFSVITVPIPEGATHLNECLADHFKEEALQDWKCDACAGSTAGKVMRIWRLPQVVTIALKRFDYRRGGFKKNSNTINVDLDVDFSPFRIGSTQSNSGRDSRSSVDKRRLDSAGVHMGNYHGGHYVAVVNDGDHFTLHDDMSTRPLKFEETCSLITQAYVLIYAPDR